ncbi:MAG: cysteine hydrolase [Deltaproteobacteria bacterium]|nr:cysteine hydrolase [Deltaproteobacteria bacterium]
MSGKALLIIDMLNDFVLEGAPLEVPSTREIIPAVKREIEAARAEGAPVIYVCDAHAPDDREFSIWPRHSVRGTEGAQVVHALKPDRDDIIVEKTTYSAFYKTDLEKVLNKLAVKELIITGCVTNICIMYAASDAVLRGYAVTVPRDCSAWLDVEDHDFAFRQMKNVLKVNVR